MKKFLLYTYILLGVSIASDLAPGLRVRFDIGLQVGKKFFYDIPRNISQAVSQNWTLTERPEGHLLSLVLYCPEDYYICIYCDNETDHIAGMQIALPQDEITEREYDWPTQGFIEWAVTNSSGVVRKYWVSQLMFTSEAYALWPYDIERLQLTAEERKAAHNESIFLQEYAVWMTGFNGSLDRVSANLSDIENTNFTKQSCIYGMGRHYFFNFTANTTCQANTIYSWFLLFFGGKLVGVGFLTPATMPVKSDQRNWFERPSKLVIQTIASNGPTCAADLATNTGILTVHIYFADKPWLIHCFGQ